MTQLDANKYQNLNKATLDTDVTWNKSLKSLKTAYITYNNKSYKMTSIKTKCNVMFHEILHKCTNYTYSHFHTMVNPQWIKLYKMLFLFKLSKYTANNN